MSASDLGSLFGALIGIGILISILITIWNYATGNKDRNSKSFRLVKKDKK